MRAEPRWLWPGLVLGWGIFAGTMVEASGPNAAQRITNDLALNKAIFEHQVIDVLVATDLVRPFVAVKADLMRSGRVMFAAEQVGYLRLRIELSEVDTVLVTPGVLRLLVDTPISRDLVVDRMEPPFEIPAHLQPLKHDFPRPQLDIAGMGRNSPAFSGYGMGLPDLFDDGVVFDGRGVGIGIVEDAPDMNHPALQRALDLDGQTLRKVGGIVALPGYDEIGGKHIPSPQRVTADAQGRFTYEGDTLFAPKPGDYWIAQAVIGGSARFIPKRTKIRVLWREEGRAWLDLEGIGDLRDVKSIGDFNVTGEVALMRAIDGDPNAVDPAAVTTVSMVFDRGTGKPVLYTGDVTHAIGVAGIAAGHNFAAGAGGAPAAHAQLLYVVHGPSGIARISQLLESLMLAAQRQDIDVLSISMGCDDLERADPVAGLLTDRIVRRWGKPIFSAAGNSLGLTETIVGINGARSVATVGAYMSAQTAKSFTDFKLPRKDYVITYSRGPTRGGLMKPDFLAPSPTIAPMIFRSPEKMASPAKVRMPPGYALFDGTSGAAPAAASAAAVLISGAKQTRIPHEASRVLWSMKAGARYLQDWPANAQGAGVLNLPQSWRLLKASAALPEWRYAPKLQVRGPLSTRMNEVVSQTKEGGGLYEREGWTVGDRGTRKIFLTRSSGPKERVRYRLEWLGNDGTFSAPAFIDLPLGVEQPLTLKIQASSEGMHSANLVLKDSQLGFGVEWISVTIVAAESLLSADDYTVSKQGTRGPLEVHSHFIAVPEAVQVLKVRAQTQGGNFNLDELPPVSVYARSLPHASYAPSWLMTPYVQRTSATRLYPNPGAGVWEFLVDAQRWATLLFQSRNEADLVSQYQLEFVALAARLKGHSVSALCGNTLGLKLEWSNEMAPLDSAVTEVRLGAQFERAVRSSDDTPWTELFIAQGTEVLNLSAKGANGQSLRLYLYRQQRGDDGLAHFKLWDVPFEVGQSLSIRKPEAGKWRLMARTDQGSLLKGQYQLSLQEFSTRFGLATVEGGAAARKSKESWRADVNVVMNRAQFKDGRQPVALVELVDEGAQALEQESLASPVDFQRPVAVGRVVIPLR